MRVAESDAGVTRDPRIWQSVLDYGWSRADGFVQVTLRHLLPYETGSCTDLLAAAP